MRIICKIGTTVSKTVDVEPNEPLKVLLGKLGISDKKTKFIWKGETYMMSADLTFQEIGMVDDSRVYVNNQGIAGKSEQINLRLLII